MRIAQPRPVEPCWGVRACGGQDDGLDGGGAGLDRGKKLGCNCCETWVSGQGLVGDCGDALVGADDGSAEGGGEDGDGGYGGWDGAAFYFGEIGGFGAFQGRGLKGCCIIIFILSAVEG